eukprot:TRINITY_DN6744_c0_g1_i1.p1 TRINITY_DN6744_c0_g1~~TRINITY_DN6744_c0_g1_i1.p1  ORF type:complete len:639 (+),score=249.62 TRINITY_DN6744_c0_g1_i1:123-1919(+)
MAEVAGAVSPRGATPPPVLGEKLDICSATDDEEVLAPIISPQLQPEQVAPEQPASLSANAPAFVPTRPHTISLFNLLDFTTATRQCDLASLTIGDIRSFAQESFPVSTSMCYDLVWAGSPLPTTPATAALDCGISNGGVVVVAVGGQQSMLQQQQMLQLQMMRQLQYNTAATMMPVEPEPVALDTSAAFTPVSTQPSPMEHSPTAGDFCSQAASADGARRLIAQLRAGSADAIQQLVRALPRITARIDQLSTHPHAAKVLVAAASVPGEHVVELLRAACEQLQVIAESNAGSEVLIALLDATLQEPRPPPTAEGTSPHLLIVAALTTSIAAICTTVNGRKVLQEVIARLDDDDAAPLYGAVCQNILAIATDQCGCITLQRLCDAATNVRYRTQLQCCLMDGAAQLITDPYGNYAVQHAVKDNHICSQLVARTVSGRIVDYAVNKFASNVIERCLQTGPDDVRELLIPEVVGAQALQSLMQDAYGNYVVQSCVDNAPPHLLAVLRDTVLPLVSRSPYGYRIETKLQRRLRQDKRGGRKGGSNGHHTPASSTCVSAAATPTVQPATPPVPNQMLLMQPFVQTPSQARVPGWTGPETAQAP